MIYSAYNISLKSEFHQQDHEEHEETLKIYQRGL